MQKDFSSLEDILFEHKNKNYGAYELRNSQNVLMTKALFIGVGISILFVFIFYLYNTINSKKNTDTGNIDHTVIYCPIDLPNSPIKESNTIRDNKKNSSLPTKNESLKPTSTVQKVDTKVGVPTSHPVNEQIMVSKQEITNSEISVLTSKGVKSTNSSVTHSVGEGGKIGNGLPSGTNVSGNSVIEAGGVDVEAYYPGGMNALRAFISKHMEYPEMAAKNNIQGKVTVKFIVEKDGTISGFEILKGIGNGCEEEILRILKKTNKKWTPAKLNGEKVRTYFILPVRFTLQNE